MTLLKSMTLFEPTTTLKSMIYVTVVPIRNRLKKLNQKKVDINLMRERFCQSLIPLDRILLFQPQSTPEKSNQELTEGSKLLFYKGRVFSSRLHLKDALLAYWFSYALVTFEGNVLLCNCGKPQTKPKNEPSLDKNDSSLCPPLAKKHRGNGLSSIKVGCEYKVNFGFVDTKDKAGPVRITGACHVHSNHDPSNLSNFTGALIKSHSPFAQLGENVEMMLASNLYLNNHLRGKDFRLMTQGYMPNGVCLTAAEACNLRRRTSAKLKDES